MKLQTLFPIVSLTLTSIPMALAAEPTPISVDDYLAKFPSTSSEEPGEHHNLCGYQQGDAAGPGLNEDNYHKIFDAGPELCLYQVKNGTERDPQTIKALWVVRGCTCRFYRYVKSFLRASMIGSTLYQISGLEYWC